MLQDDGRRRGAAIDWVISLRDPARADWVGFTEWLEADPANNAAYEAVALDDRDMARALADASLAPAASNDNPAPRFGRRVYGWAAGAAAAVAAVAGYPLIAPGVSTYAVETGAGERRLVMLDDGTRIDLNGGTRVLLRKGDTRVATLERGEAAFTVVHNAADPFTVKAGWAKLQDVGTTFNVLRSADALEVAVAEGAVVYNPHGEAVRLDAGKTLRVSASSDSVVIGSVDPTAIAAWRQGRLIYRGAPLAQVAADLSRNLGVGVSVEPGIAARPFSGVIMLDQDRKNMLTRIGAVLDVRMIHKGNAWLLAPRTSATH